MSLQTQFISDTLFQDRRGTFVIWLGNAGALIQSRGTTVLIDPLISMMQRDGKDLLESGHRLKLPLPITADRIPHVDAVMCTHTDIDHFGETTSRILNQRLDPLFIGPPMVCARWRNAGFRGHKVQEVYAGDQFPIGEVTVTVSPALHDWNPVNPFRLEDCCGFILQTPDGTIWHPGDTRLLEDHMSVKGVDVLFFDIAEARAHLGPTGSAKLASSCGASYLIAYHYGTLDVPPGGPFGSDPAGCYPLIANLSARFLPLRPGEPLWLER